MSAEVLSTGRLDLRRLSADGDAGFILRLLNEPSYLRYIGDKGVRTLEDARRYIETGPVESYARHGFGLYLVQLKEGRQPIGVCGLIRRDTLPHPDLGFAFLPQFWSRGYAYESAAAVIRHERAVHGVTRLLAVTSADNTASITLLGRLGFRFERVTRWTDGERVNLFALDV